MDQQLFLKDLAVLLIDMQDGFILGDPVKLSIIPSQISVLRFSKENNIPVIIFNYEKYGETTEALNEEIKKMGTKNLYFFIKKRNDAFSVLGFDSILKEKGVTKLFIMGINAGFCIYSTAKTAIEKGYKIITSADVIAGYTSEFRTTECPGRSWYEENGIFKKDHRQIIEEVIGP